MSLKVLIFCFCLLVPVLILVPISMPMFLSTPIHIPIHTPMPILIHIPTKLINEFNAFLNIFLLTKWLVSYNIYLFVYFSMIGYFICTDSFLTFMCVPILNEK